MAEKLIQSVGEFGRFQYIVAFVLGLISALSSMSIYATIFVVAEPEFTCTPKNGSAAINATQCEIFRGNWSTYNCTFDTTYYNSTITKDWNLTCTDKPAFTQTMQIFGSMFGFFSGVFGDKYGRKKAGMVFTFLTFLTFTITQLLLMRQLGLATDTKYIIYCVSQFLVGLLISCVYCTCYVLLFEFTTQKYHTVVSNVQSYFYVFGELIVLAVYYLFREWELLNWSIALYALVLIFLFGFVVPESPEWLISMGRTDEALVILRHIARVNKKKSFFSLQINVEEDGEEDSHHHHHHQGRHRHIGRVSISKTNAQIVDALLLNQALLDQNRSGTRSDDIATSMSSSSKTTPPVEAETDEIRPEKTDFFLIKMLFVPRTNLVQTCLLTYTWIALMLLYYGTSLGVTNVSEHLDPFLMYLVSSVGEMLGIASCHLIDVLGRKRTFMGYFALTCLTNSMIGLITEFYATGSSTGWSLQLAIVMCMVFFSKGNVSGAYNMAYIYSSELYSISIRNTSIIFLTCLGSSGSLVAPYINPLKKVWPPLPYMLYGLCAFLACVCIFFLRETKVSSKSKQKQRQQQQRREKQQAKTTTN